MRVTLALAATAMMAFAAPAFAQQALQPGSPGVGAGGVQPYTGGPADAGPDQYRSRDGMRDGMNEGRAAAPDYPPRGETSSSGQTRTLDPMAPTNPATRNNGQ